MVADSMSLIYYSIIYMWEMVDISTEAEKCSLGIVLFQGIEHPFGDFGSGTIVECQEQGLGATFDFPHEVVHHSSDNLWRMVYYSNHAVLCFAGKDRHYWGFSIQN